MDETDPFWKLALDSEISREVDHISPRQFDEIRLKSLDAVSWISQDIAIKRQTSNYPISSIQVSVKEQRSQGVFDLIGGETWEAAYLLAAFILKYPAMFMKKTCLELGSGVGLPSLLLTALKVKDPQDSGSVILTDYEQLLLENLKSSVTTQFEECQPDDSAVSLRIAPLDWLSCAEEDLPSLTMVELIMGSALVYQPDHAEVANVMLRYLTAGCKEVLVIQMSSRPGFDVFLRKLHQLGLSVNLEPIPDDIYELAQMISVLPQCSPDQHSSLRVTTAGGSSRVVTDTIVTERTFEFPSSMLRSVNEALGLGTVVATGDVPQVVWKWGGNGPCGIGGRRNNLIKSDISAFVIMRITKVEEIVSSSIKSASPPPVGTALFPTSTADVATKDDDADLMEDEMISLFMHWYGVRSIKPENFSPERFTSVHMTDLWSKLWFAKGVLQNEVDRQLSEKYVHLFPIVTRSHPREWLSAVETSATKPLSTEILRVLTVACIILFDQIPRNVFRNSAKAYETDDFAFILVENLMKRDGFDDLALPIKISVILVFIHSERIEDLEKTGFLLKSIESQMVDHFPDVLKSLKQIAENHKIRMEMFGRIPERNTFIGRQSTEEEKAFMRSFKSF